MKVQGVPCGPVPAMTRRCLIDRKVDPKRPRFGAAVMSRGR